MFKEVIISIIIVISITSLDFVTQNYTKDTVSQTSSMLTDLKENIKMNEDNLSYKINQIYEKWEERREKLAYFIEHNELEKVETSLTDIKSSIEEDDKNMAISGIDEAKFILEHIKEKNAFNLENIF